MSIVPPPQNLYVKENMEIKLLKLYCHPYVLPPVVWHHNSSPMGEKQDIPSWWTKSDPKFKKEVFEKRERDDDIDAVCVVISKLPKVTIFCHSYSLDDGFFANPQVIANKDIKEVKDLVKVKDDASQGDMIYAEWEDASINRGAKTFEEVEKSYGLVKSAQLGFLIHKNEKRVYIGGRFNHSYKKYRQLEAIPTGNILKMVKLQVK